MIALFATHNDWTETTCHYVAAVHGNYYALLSGPYRTEAEADSVLPDAQHWAIRASGDPRAAQYRYLVFTAVNGHSRSILGEIRPMQLGGLTRFDGYEISGVREFYNGSRTYCEQARDAEADYWSLYGHIPGEGVECIGDFKTRSFAEEVYTRITGRMYGA